MSSRSPVLDSVAVSGGTRRFLTFRLAERLYALPAESVAEVIRVPAVARVPQSPPALLGLANLRGAVLPLVSVRQLIGVADSAERTDAAKAIVLDGAAPLALSVDSVDALVAVAEDNIEVREAELSANEGERLTGAFHTGTRAEAAKILDVERLLSGAFAHRRQSARKSRGRAAAERQRQQPEAGADSAAATMLVTFEVAGQEFALELDSVQEILSAPDVLAAVPRAEALVLGVTSLRNRLLPLLSLRGLLGLPAAAGWDGREKVVVVKIGGAYVGLVADRAKAIVAAAKTAIDALPPVLAARAAGESRLKAIYRGDNGRRLVSILMPEQLFREDVMRRLGQRNENADARAQASESAHAELQFLVFRLGADEFGLPIAAVDEVGEVPESIARVPKTPKFLEGVVNLRGDVLPVVDQRRRFEMPARDAASRRRLVVVRSDGQRAGLIVDDVSDVLRVSAGAVEPAPELTEQIGRLVRGVINLEQSQRIVLVLDPSELLTPAERGRLDAFQKATREGA
jgi:purine-binding chemotaxis protein CheW